MHGNKYKLMGRFILYVDLCISHRTLLSFSLIFNAVIDVPKVLGIGSGILTKKRAVSTSAERAVKL